MRFLKKELPRGWRDLFERYSKTRKSLIVLKYIGKNLRHESADSITSPSGFSIYFPKEFGEFNGEFGKIFQNESSEFAGEFIKKFSWDNFIHEYYEKLKQSRN